MMLAEVGFLQESAVQLSRNIAIRFFVRMIPKDPNDAMAGFAAAND
jgi:hypothetical protein